MKKLILFSVLIVSLLFISCSNKNNDVTPEKSPVENLKKDPKVDYSTIKQLDLQKDNVNFFVDGKSLTLDSNLYLDKNRYYICLNEFIDKLEGEFLLKNNIISATVLNNNFSIDLSNNNITSNNKTFVLKNLIHIDKDIYYMDLSDLFNILDMYTKWDKETKTIYCKSNGNNVEGITPYTPSIETLGFLRLEDVALTLQPINNDYFEKIRVIGNYLGKINVPYHIAWVPRAIYPSQGLDLDPMTRNDFATAEMVYSLDFISHNNGLIGLHGYTHQSDNEETGIGTEFGYKQPSTDRFKERLESAIKTAQHLNIPINFFEAPHYAITAEQNKIAEQYFKVLYYPLGDLGNVDLTKPQLSPYNKTSYYISTPLDYIKFDNVNGSVEALKNCNTGKMGSIFYHPVLDFDYIKFNVDNNIPTYTYDNNSPLKRIITILDDKGFKMSKVSDI